MRRFLLIDSQEPFEEAKGRMASVWKLHLTSQVQAGLDQGLHDFL